MKEINIIPIGRIDPDILESIRAGLVKIFPWSAVIEKEIRLPEETYSPRRKQYHAAKILGILKAPKHVKSESILGVTNVELYVPELNFVFGEADMRSGTALISLARLKPEFYGLQPDKKLCAERAIKEAVHELGHVCGLDHCDSPDCVMYFSNSINDTDRKGPGFCRPCKEMLGI